MLINQLLEIFLSQREGRLDNLVVVLVAQFLVEVLSSSNRAMRVRYSSALTALARSRTKAGHISCIKGLGVRD